MREEGADIEDIEIRPLLADELPLAVALADSIFRADDRRSMLRSLPKVFSASLLQSVGGFAGRELVTFAGMVPAAVRLGPARLSVYAYGSVCTHPASRGKGYAAQALAYARRAAHEAASSALLVSGELPLYLEAGCVPFGDLLHVTYGPEWARRRREAGAGAGGAAGEAAGRVAAGGTAAAGDGCTARGDGAACGGVAVRLATGRDWHRLHRLACRRRLGFEQSVWDLADLVQSAAVAAIRGWPQRVYIAEDEGGGELGFAVIAYEDGDRGAGRQAQIVEWAGSLHGLGQIAGHAIGELGLAALHGYIADPEQIACCESQQAAGLRLERVRNQGTICITHAEQLFGELGVYWQARGLEPWPALRRLPDGRFVVRLGGLRSLPLDRAELASLVFGAVAGSGGAQAHPPDFLEAASRFFPVPLPYTKGLNFV